MCLATAVPLSQSSAAFQPDCDEAVNSPADTCNHIDCQSLANMQSVQEMGAMLYNQGNPVHLSLAVPVTPRRDAAADLPTCFFFTTTRLPLPVPFCSSNIQPKKCLVVISAQWTYRICFEHVYAELVSEACALYISTLIVRELDAPVLGRLRLQRERERERERGGLNE